MERSNPFPINHFRTLSHATEGEGFPIFHFPFSAGDPRESAQIRGLPFQPFVIPFVLMQI